jgi:hypothetical protein
MCRRSAAVCLTKSATAEQSGETGTVGRQAALPDRAVAADAATRWCPCCSPQCVGNGFKPEIRPA